MLVLHATQDHTAPVACATRIAGAHARRAVRILPRSYHLIAVDVERDIVAAEVGTFFAVTPSRANHVMRHVIAIDQGTTGTTVLVLDERARSVRGRGYREFRQIYPQPGWVEHDPEEIWASVDGRARRARSARRSSRRRSRPSASPTSARRRSCGTARPASPSHNAIVWQDRRTADRCAELKAAGHEARVARAHRPGARSVLLGTKIAWLLDNVTGARARAERGELAFGTDRQLPASGG